MECFEIVHLRSYSQADSNDAIEAFHQLTFPDKEKAFEDITLLRDIILDNDLCICICWHGVDSGKGKESFGSTTGCCVFRVRQDRSFHVGKGDPRPSGDKEKRL